MHWNKIRNDVQKVIWKKKKIIFHLLIQSWMKECCQEKSSGLLLLLGISRLHHGALLVHDVTMQQLTD